MKGCIRTVFIEIEKHHRLWLFIKSLKEYVQKIFSQDLFIDFSKAFGLIHRGKMEWLLLVYGFLKKLLLLLWWAIKHKNNGHLPDNDTDFFDIHRNLAKRYIGTISIHNLWISIDLMKENGFTIKKKRQAADFLQKLLQLQITQMIGYFLQIHLFKLNLCCIAWSRQQGALISMWTVFYSKWCNFLIKWQDSEISWPFHIAR